MLFYSKIFFLKIIYPKSCMAVHCLPLKIPPEQTFVSANTWNCLMFPSSWWVEYKSLGCREQHPKNISRRGWGRTHLPSTENSLLIYLQVQEKYFKHVWVVEGPCQSCSLSVSSAQWWRSSCAQLLYLHARSLLKDDRYNFIAVRHFPYVMNWVPFFSQFSFFVLSKHQ